MFADNSAMTSDREPPHFQPASLHPPLQIFRGNMLFPAFKKANHFAERMGPGVRTFSAVGMVLLVGLISHFTGPGYALSVFFMFPIVFSSWYDGRRAGLGLSIFSTLVWLGTDFLRIEQFSYIYVPIINETFRLIIFIFVSVLVAEFRKSLEIQKKIARTDSLTGMSNRLAFFETAALEIKRAQRFAYPLSFIYLDIDNFKTVNDTCGHDAGDRLLKMVAKIILHNVRKIDLAVRFGGDEMGILLVETDTDGALFLAKKLQRKLSAEMTRQGWPVTFSMGVGTFQQIIIPVGDMIQIVDKLMYFAKKSGKNKIIHQVFASGENPEDRIMTSE